MHWLALPLLALTTGQTDALGPGDHTRYLNVDQVKRNYLVHVPRLYDGKTPTPVVLALHGATMTAKVMESLTGLNKKADEETFIVVYPNGTGPTPFLYTWNAGGFSGFLAKGKNDDIAFLGKVLDDVESVLKVDRARVYACGLSNGAMMCYRLAAEMSDRIAAIAPVAGTIACEKCTPRRPVPVLHIHGTADALVPYTGSKKDYEAYFKFASVEDSVRTWVKLNGCANEPEVVEVLPTRDKYKVICKKYNSGKDGAEVVLYVVEGGGHTWPGRPVAGGFLGPVTYNIRANDAIWEFFQRHPMKQPPP